MTGPRLQVGRQLRVVSEALDIVHVEGRARLRPGQVIELLLDTLPGVEARVRRARVLSWSVARLGKDGPTYEGRCQWQ